MQWGWSFYCWTVVKVLPFSTKPPLTPPQYRKEHLVTAGWRWWNCMQAIYSSLTLGEGNALSLARVTRDKCFISLELVLSEIEWVQSKRFISIRLVLVHYYRVSPFFISVFVCAYYISRYPASSTLNLGMRSKTESQVTHTHVISLVFLLHSSFHSLLFILYIMFIVFICASWKQ